MLLLFLKIDVPSFTADEKGRSTLRDMLPGFHFYGISGYSGIIRRGHGARANNTYGNIRQREMFMTGNMR